MRELDSNLPVFDMRPMSIQLAGTLILERILAVSAGGFGEIATLLSGIGLYGVLSYSMAQRRREIGLRMALGAQGGDIARLALREVLGMFVIGGCAAVPAGFALARLVEAQLHRVSPYDPLNALGAASILAATGALAAWLPVARAARTEPMKALRFE